MQQTSGDHADARPWTVTLVVGLTAILAASGFFMAHRYVEPVAPGRPEPPYPWFAVGMPIATYAVLATGIWFGRQWARICLLLLGVLNATFLVVSLANGYRTTASHYATTLGFVAIVLLLLVPVTHRWFSDRPKTGQYIDTPSVLVVPTKVAGPGPLFLGIFGAVLFVAVAAISEGAHVVTFLVGAFAFGLLTLLVLALDCRESRLEFDGKRVVIRHRLPLLASLDVAFPTARFGSVRTSLTKDSRGSVRYDLQLVTRDGGHTILLAFGETKAWMHGMSDAEFEPEDISDIRRTIARRLGIRDEGCVGFDRRLPAVPRREGERP